MGIVGKLKEWLSLEVVPLLGILLFTSFLLFLPTVALEKLNLAEFKNTYSTYFGLGLIFSSALLIALTLNAFWRVFLSHWLKDIANVYFYKKEVKNLTDEEKAILNYFIKGKTRSASLSITDGVVLGLETRKIIVRVGNVGTCAMSMSFPFNIQPWAWGFLNKNPHLLEVQK